MRRYYRPHSGRHYNACLTIGRRATGKDLDQADAQLFRLTGHAVDQHPMEPAMKAGFHRGTLFTGFRSPACQLNGLVAILIEDIGYILRVGV